MADYTLIHTEDIEGKGTTGKLKMLKNDLNAEQVAISVRTFGPHSGQRGDGGHKHEQIEEVFYVVKGNLVLKLDDEEIAVKTGDAMRIPPQTMRAYQNDGDEEAMIIIASPILPGGKSDGIHVKGFWKD